uniref:Uncharacterized protein n=1 Tax=Arundo donax TaxID=35708 RepID=A0A0A9HGJ5_ARUDO
MCPSTKPLRYQRISHAGFSLIPLACQKEFKSYEFYWDHAFVQSSSICNFLFIDARIELFYYEMKFLHMIS